jgi:arsenite/tail-anchored protein-transporting ATPase
VRLLLFAGTGGAGTTTVAAATALHAARRGVKTLLLAPEPTGGPAWPAALGGATGASAPAEVAPGLFAHHVDARARSRRGWDALRSPLAALLKALGVDPLEEPEFTGLPGLDDVLTLLEIRDAAAVGWDLVIVDTPGLARTLRLLALPEELSRSLQRMVPIERRLLWAMGHGASAVTGTVPPRGMVEAAERVQTDLAGVRETLTASGAAVRLVLTAEPPALAAAGHARTTLALHGLAVDAVTVNRIVPGDGNDVWRRARAAAQDAALADAAATFAPLPLGRVAERAAPPAHLEDLAGIGDELYSDALPDVEAPGRPAPQPAVERAGDEFALVLPLPLAVRSDVELGRRGDELLVDVAGQRRVLTLPSVLRRCDVTGAVLRDGALRVRFRPDPDLWRSL